MSDQVVELYRFINVVLTSAAFGGLVWRLVGRWTLSYMLAKIVVALLAVAELLFAVAVARQAALGNEINEASFGITLHALAILWVVIWWPWLLQRDPPRHAVGG